MGSMAQDDIQPNEAFAYIPNKLCITSEKARNSDLSVVYRSHLDIFQNHQERDFYVMVLFLMYERPKGEESFWHPYFEVCEVDHLPAFWPDEELNTIAS